ncbi:hypothetical protein EMPS_03074 [Entomortierella parvispora]|uniref:Pentacotripeptide-repeat region of PRORP domain-containing protein n=1 Tax=Entomortierella parvispora TaxID=205924 RepID=A0A9P3H5X3_9FUNG|nr:hypothetical protein EMPS_03074 [Entomortierella parvispora]
MFSTARVAFRSTLIPSDPALASRVSTLKSTSRSDHGSSAAVKSTVLTPPAPPIVAGTSKPQRSKKSLRRSPLGSHRRKLAAMHRVRLLKDVKRMKQATPRHSAQLSALSTVQSKTRTRTILQQKRRVEQFKAGRDYAYTMDAYGRLYPRYHHVHYHYKKQHKSRIRFLGFQHFLQRNRLTSERGRKALHWQRSAKLSKINQTHRNRNAIGTPRFQVTNGRLLLYLNRAIEQGLSEKAIRTAKLLLRVKRCGATLPRGRQCTKLIEMNEACYTASKKEPTSSPAVQFTVAECNAILSHCADIKDWTNGLRITNLLMTRYQSPGFDYGDHSMAAPNAATIHMMSTHYANSNRPDTALKMFQVLTKRYPSPIPVEIYASYLHQLSTKPESVLWIQKTLNHLWKHGPSPTASTYNVLLKAVGTGRGSRHAENILKEMELRGVQADQQTFRILMQLSLQDLKVNKAHFWLGEYRRHGFEVPPRMLDIFMKTCVEYSISAQAYSDSLAREWMYKALHVMQLISREGFRPTSRSYEYLIQGFLSQGKVREAKAAMDLMRNDSYLYTPTQKTWILLFEYHLSKGDEASAIEILNDMRRERTTGWGSSVLQAVSAMNRLPDYINPVPTSMYHQLFQHLLDHNKVSGAERALYELLIRQKQSRPRGKEVVKLIWELERHPKAAERVYELLYSQTEFESSNPGRTGRHRRNNRILIQGPIQMANVGVMRAKALSGDRTLHEETWKAWIEMTERFEAQSKFLALDAPKSVKDRQVLASAFDETVRALRHSGPKERDFQLLRRPKSKEDKPIVNDWDFSSVQQSSRRGTNSETQKQLVDRQGRPISERIPSKTVNKHLEASNKHRALLQQLLTQNGFLRPLTQRRASANDTEGEPLDDVSSVDSLLTEEQESHRLNQLRTCLEWAQKNQVPIQVQGLNCLLESLKSHQANEDVKEVVERYFLTPRSSGKTGKSRKPLMAANLQTLKVLAGHTKISSTLTTDHDNESNLLVDRVLSSMASSKSAGQLREDWFRHVDKEKAKRERLLSTGSPL